MRFYRWVKKWAERVAALRIPLYAGNSAFFLLLSLFPLMSILLAILQRTSLQEADVLRLLAQVSPAALMPLFEDLLDGLYDVQPVSLISISAVTVVWSSSKGMYSLLLGLNAVDGVTETRGYLRLRLLGILCTLGMLLALVVTLLLNVYGKSLLRLLSAGGGFAARLLEFTMQELHLYSTVFLMIVFTLFYLVLPNRRRRLTRALPARSARPSRGTSSLRRFRFMSTIFRVPPASMAASRSCSSAFSGSISASRSSSMARFSIASSSAASAKIRSAPSYRGGAFPLW